MNLTQLGKIREHLKCVRELLKEDIKETVDIEQALDELQFEVDKELKNILWMRYTEGEG